MGNFLGSCQHGPFEGGWAADPASGRIGCRFSGCGFLTFVSLPTELFWLVGGRPARLSRGAGLGLFQLLTDLRIQSLQMFLVLSQVRIIDLNPKFNSLLSISRRQV